MKVLLLSADEKLFEEDSSVRKRIGEYGDFVDGVYVVVYTSGKKDLHKQSYKNVFLYPTDDKFKFCYLFSAFFISRKIIKKEKIELVSSQEGITNIVGVLLKLFYKIKLNIEIHTDIFSPYFKKELVKNRLRFFGYKTGIYFADGVRVASERILDGLRTKEAVPISVLPIYTVFDSQNGKSAVNFGKYILMVSRLSVEKNIKLAFESLKAVFDTYKDIKLVVVGDGAEREKLERAACELGLKDRIVFVGWQKNVYEYYRNATLYLLTSNYEGYGLTIIEAILAGCPVVSTDVGIASAENSLMCDVGDKISIKNNILKILGDEKVKDNLIKNAKDWLKNNGYKNKEEYIKKYIGHWRKVACVK